MELSMMESGVMNHSSQNATSILLPLRSVVGITCALSILGSLLIIISYVLFRELRTNARLVLVHISLADLGVAASNLFGDAFRFERYFNSTTSELEPAVVQTICKAQAFIAHFSTISSVLWTMALAALMYAVVKRLITAKNSKGFMCFFCVFCYGLSLFVSVWMICTRKLGFSPIDTLWCRTIVDNSDLKEVNYMAAVFGYDLWIVLTCVFIIVTYLSLHLYVRQERNESGNFQELKHSIDYKFIVIPIVFVLLRTGSMVQNFLLYIDAPKHNTLDESLKYVAGVGDSGQGALNGILFVIFTPNVRQKLASCLCWCCRRSRRRAQSPEVLVDSYDSRDSLDDNDQSSPVKIGTKKDTDLCSMATTTTMSHSPLSYYGSFSSYSGTIANQQYS